MWCAHSRKPDHRDADARPRDRRVAEDVLAAEAGDHLADHAHPGQDHDVHGRVAVEPEHVLEQHRVAAEGRVEDADARTTRSTASRSSVMASTGVREQLNQARRVHAPRRTAAAGPRSCPGQRILWIVTMMFSPVMIELKPDDEHADHAGHDVRLRLDRVLYGG